MKYEVDQFILLDLDKEGKGIQNSNGFTILKDKRIYKFLGKKYEKIKIKFLLDFALKYLR